MDKAKAVEALKEAGIDADVIKALTGDSGTDDRLKALEAKLEAEIGKANGILGDKKKAQEKAAELQAKIDELESKDLGEVEKLKLELERLQSKYDQSEAQRAELESTYNAEKRSNGLNKIGSGLKWMDNVPEQTRKLILESEFKDMDLGNEVLVADRLKTINETYAGLLASDAPSGAGSKPGKPSAPTNKPTAEQIANPDLAKVAKDPLAYVQAAIEANQ